METEMETPYIEVSFTLPFSLPFDGKFEFEWQGNQYWVRVENEQVWDERSKAVTGFEIATSGGGSVTMSGPHGLSHLAGVVVRFPGVVGKPDPTQPGAQQAVDQRERACVAVNRIIEVYRNATSDFRVRRIMPNYDVVSFKYSSVGKDGTGPGGWMMGDRGPSYPVRMRDLSSPEGKAMMDDALAFQIPVPAWIDYRHEARRFFEEREFRLAIILLSTSLELFWAEVLELGMFYAGTGEAEVRRRLRAYTTPTNNMGTIARLDYGLREVFGRSLRDDQPDLYRLINDKARRLRKNVIHPKVKRPTAEETFEAMVGIEQALTWLTREIYATMREPTASQPSDSPT